MKDDLHIRIGIPAPETADDVNRASTIAGMRSAILMAQRDSAIIQTAVHLQLRDGISGEDMMTYIAYQALRQLEDSFRREIYRLQREPMPPLIRSGDMKDAQ